MYSKLYIIVMRIHGLHMAGAVSKGSTDMLENDSLRQKIALTFTGPEAKLTVFHKTTLSSHMVDAVHSKVQQNMLEHDLAYAKNPHSHSQDAFLRYPLYQPARRSHVGF
jgi:hypothetical protein